MKKVKSGNRSSAAKGRGAPKNVGEYFAGVPKPTRSMLNKMRCGDSVRCASGGYRDHQLWDSRA
ncbi:MAG TPA: hypothetical protein VFN26_03085 [Candidatus Acidoferrum sp.]|nr:hypothetical protein [Candidatus Acidoferrum sp.]